MSDKGESESIRDTEQYQSTQSINKSKRTRKSTEKGLEYKTSQLNRKFKSKVSLWRKHSNVIETLLSGPDNSEQIKTARTQLSSEFDNVHRIYFELDEILTHHQMTNKLSDRYESI